MNFLILLALCLGAVESYKFLVAVPLPVRSLNILGEGIVRQLLNAGHEVTFVTGYPKKDNKNPKLRQIDISKNLELLQAQDELNIAYLMENDALVNDDFYIQNLTVETARLTLQNKNVQALLKNPKEQFDAVIIDWCDTDLYAGLASVFNAHLIWSYSIGPYWQILRLIDEPSNPAYSINGMSAYTPPLSFLERVDELYAQINWAYLKRFKILSREKEIYYTYLGPAAALRGRTIPDYEDAVFNATLVVSNAHHAIGGWPKTPQNFKFVGGFHIDDPPKPLPADLQKLMDNAPHGVIYFSMGSTWKSKDIPKHVTENLVKLFGRLKQTVIWKYEEDLSNKPKNLHIIKWAPQTSILAHPKLLFFITHGGLLSSTESIHFGVPAIGIPIYYDQFHNVNKAVNAGYALKVDLSMDLPAKLEIAIQEMLTNSSYTQKAKDLSMKYHDRPAKPGVELVHWIEHVVKTNGAAHLRSPALHVPAYQKLFLDLVALVLLIVIVVLWLLKKIFTKNVTKHGKTD